ncbi:unnamed protein product [Agarophyton chilense]
MSWKHGEDISCAHAFLSLEEVRNRRVAVKQGDHVEYDQGGRTISNNARLQSESLARQETSSSRKLNSRVWQRVGAAKSHVTGVVDRVLKYGENSVKNKGRLASCFKSASRNKASRSGKYGAGGVTLRFATTKSAQSNKKQNCTYAEDDKGPEVTTTTSVNTESTRDLSTVRAAPVCSDELESPRRISEGLDSERVKSKLPSQEPVPHVESGFVKRAVRSYIFNIANDKRARSSTDGDTEPTTNELPKWTDPSSNKSRKISFSEHIEHSMTSSRSESPVFEVKTKEGDKTKEDYKSGVRGSDYFKSSYVARIAESLDYFIEHEQSERRPGLRPISPVSR